MFMVWSGRRIISRPTSTACLTTHSANDGSGRAESWPFDKAFYLKLNIAVGGDWGGYEGIDDSIFPAEYVIDYVRVYQR